MVRAFTIAFEFEGKTYLALTSMKTTAENEQLYFVRVFDEALTKILPERSLHYSSSRPLCPASLNHPQALRLFTCINDAVSDHLKASTSIL